MASPNPPRDTSDSRLSLLSLWVAIRKNWLLVAVLTAIVGSGMAFFTLGQTKIYEVSGTILFDPNVPQPLGEQVASAIDGSSYWNNKEYYKTQQWIIQSQRIALQVARDLDLHRDADFLANRPATPGGKTKANAKPEQAADALMSRLSVEQVRDSRLTNVKYRDADPARAQRVLNALLDSYAENNLNEVFESATTAADWLRTQVGTLRQDLESSEKALHEYKKQQNMLSMSMDDQSNMLRNEMTQLNKALTEVRTKREGVAARLTELRKIQPATPLDVPSLELLGSPLLSDLRVQYVEVERDVRSLESEGRGENHPLVRAARARLDTVRAALLAEVKNIQDASERDFAALTREMAGLQALYSQAERRALDVNLLEIEYNRLRRAKENNEKLFSLVIERSKETDLTRMLRVNNVRVVARPGIPGRPISPNVPLNIAGGIVAGLMMGLIAAIGREQLDRTIKTPDDVEHELGQTLLGLLPELVEGRSTPSVYAPRRRPGRGGRHRESGDSAAESDSPIELFVHHRPTSGTAEAARAIRTNILFMSPDRPYRSLLVTSAAPSEGKTTVACAIATTMAQAGQRVVLVDCDLRRPRLHRVFRVSNDCGMTTTLLDPSLEDSIAIETEVPNLWVCPSGPIPPNPAEVLQSEALRSLIGRLRDRFDRVVIDSPPTVPVTDAAILSTCVDGVVVVVRASVTTKDLVRRALKSLRDVSASMVGVILNAVDLDGRQYPGYQYYYYKREGYGPRDAATQEKHAGSDHIGTA